MARMRILVVDDESTPQRDLQEGLQRLGLRVQLPSEEEWGIPFTALRNIAEAIIASDENGRILFLNPQAEALTGWPRTEASGRPLTEVLRLETQAGAFNGNAGPVPDSGETILVARDGARTPVEAKSVPYSANDSQASGNVLILRDVSERRRAEAAFRRTEKRYRDLAEVSRDIIFTLSAEGLLTSLNPAFEKATGLAARDWLYRPFTDLLIPSDTTAAQDAFRRVLQREWLPPLEMRLKTAAGGEVAVECVCTPANPEDQPGGLWGIARDITYRRNLEQRALQAQKMDALGRLAGTIAHDFNNLLTTINGNADMLSQALETAGPKLHGYVKAILGAADRAAELTRELLLMGRQRPEAPRKVDLNTVLRRVLPTLRGLADEGIDVTAEETHSLPAVFIDPGQLERCISILVANARDAMPKGGKLSFSTSLDPQPGGTDRVRLKVADTGTGMGDEVKARLFEPFFTTKPVGKGTGLGLSTLYGFVKSSGGEIQVNSTPGQGTTFILSFPATGNADAPLPAAPAPLAESGPGAETILLVEDDDDVRFLLQSILKSHGYSVIEAKDGEQALAVAAGQRSPIHLVLTDLQMPKLGGRKLVERLLSAHPGIKVLFMSGFGREDFPEEEVGGLPVSFLEKPFMPKSLIRHIRKVLDE